LGIRIGREKEPFPQKKFPRADASAQLGAARREALSADLVVNMRFFERKKR